MVAFNLQWMATMHQIWTRYLVEGTRVVVVVVEVTGIAVAAIVIELCTSLCILLSMK